MSNAADASKRAKREHARELAREMREKDRKRRLRNRIFIQGGVGVGVLAIAAVIILVIVSTNAPAGPGPKNMASDGILLTGDGTSVSAVTTGSVAADAEPVDTDFSKYTDKVNIVTYVDYQCPYCAQFEATNAEQIESWVQAGLVNLEIHPIAFLDSASQGTKYSTRAANAAACVAQYDPNSYLAFNSAMFTNQPAESTSGLTDDEIKTIVSDAGITDSKVATCIDDGTFTSWTKAETDRVLDARTAANGGDGSVIPNSNGAYFGGTPFVVIDGTQYSDSITDATAFATAVATAAQAKGITDDSGTDATSTPTPTPAATN